ncbi:MAG: acetate/propionate family kinase [Gammaproteobacteria bacterium]|jgi:acetate kinase
MQILVINCGSSSLKYQVIDSTSGASATRGQIERIGGGRSHVDALGEVIAAITAFPIDGIGHRVVHGGERFRQAHLIDDDVVTELEALVPLAPLHNPANIAGIRAARAAFPDLPHVAVFDTAFHATMPRRASTYAVDRELAAKLNIRRYGFHGPSHKYVAGLAARQLHADPGELRLITCHLGNGASVCAVEFGQSVETSMGMTPLEGLVMGTRSGDLDPAIVLELQRSGGFSIDEVDRLLNEQSGLAGLSGSGGDMRDLEAQAAAGDDGARLAITVFCHRVKKYIGAYAAAMGGVDAIVMTGGIGENSSSIRRRILQRLEFLGLRLDEDRNADARPGPQSPVAALHGESSRVKAFAIATNEELMIARETASILEGHAEVTAAGPIPIAISARHVHLDEGSLKALFGAGASLTKLRDISQPGQFACEELVSLIGPKGRIDGVRVLGPLRSKTQIEISRTDEFHLGVDAPIRASGRIEGSAPITLEGPAGKIDLKEGLICAWRHIHMTGEDAGRFGVENGEYIEVAVTGGERDLIFQDVMVRVAPAYILEMHIDTDEANAAELGRGASGNLVYTHVGDAAHAVVRTKRI